MIGPEVENGYQFDVARVRAWLIDSALKHDHHDATDLTHAVSNREARLGFRWSRSLDATYDAIEAEWRRRIPDDDFLINACRRHYDKCASVSDRRDRRHPFGQATWWLVWSHADEILRKLRDSRHGHMELVTELTRYEASLNGR